MQNFAGVQPITCQTATLFCHQAYQKILVLKYSRLTRWRSAEANQLRPLLFRLAIHLLLSSPYIAVLLFDILMISRSKIRFHQLLWTLPLSGEKEHPWT
jgi:hypothetical protein